MLWQKFLQWDIKTWFTIRWTKGRIGKKGKYSYPDRIGVNMRLSRIGMFECYLCWLCSIGNGFCSKKTYTFWLFCVTDMRYPRNQWRMPLRCRRESSKFRTHIALQAFAGSMPLWVSGNPLRLLMHITKYSGDGLSMLLSFVDCDEAHLRLCRVGEHQKMDRSLHYCVIFRI